MEILELFTRTGKKVVVFRQTDTFCYKYTYTYAFVIFLKLGSNVGKAEAAGMSAREAIQMDNCLAAVKWSHDARI